MEVKITMKDKSKKFIFGILMCTLVLWNIFITIKLYEDQPSGDQNGSITNNVQNISYATTDLTKASEKGILRTVAISTDTGSGSGAVYKTVAADNQYEVTIITNNHVVGNNKQVNVLFANGQTIEGDVVGGDLFTDLAVVKVVTNFAVDAFDIGDSEGLRNGEWVLAVGSPLGLEFSGSVSEGIVSATERIIGVDLNNDGTDDWDMLVIQTTAAINPGNSGGALINLNGELVGINSMKISQESVEGIGFAIPIQEAIPIVEQLIEHQKVVRPLIGISGRSISDYSIAQRSYYGLPLDVESGVVVTDIVRNGAADKVGVKVGDIIVEMNGEPIENFKTFRINLYKQLPGDEIKVKINRANQLEEVTITLE